MLNTTTSSFAQNETNNNDAVFATSDDSLNFGNWPNFGKWPDVSNWSDFNNQPPNTPPNYDDSDRYKDDWPYFDLLGLGFWAAALFVVVMGTVGNVLQFVMMCDVRLNRLSYPVYLKFLSFSDTLLLFGQLLEYSEEILNLPSAVNLNDALCKILNSLRFCTKLLSPWLVVGLTLDRYVCVCFPMSRDRLCTRKKAAVVCFGMVLACTFLVTPILFGLKIDDDCGCSSPDDFRYYFVFVRLLVSSTLPCLVILVFNVCIIVRIRKGAAFRKAFKSSTNDSTKPKQDTATRPLVTISVLAFVTLIPVSVAECTSAILNQTGGQHEKEAAVLGDRLLPIFELVYMLNFGQNFYILIASASTYRDIMASKVVCLRRRRNTPRETAVTAVANVVESELTEISAQTTRFQCRITAD